MTRTKESGWSVKRLNKSQVTVEGIYGDIASIVDEILDRKSSLGILAAGTDVQVLNTRGFPAKEFVEKFEERNKGSILNFFPIVTSFDIDKKHYVVKYSNNPAYKVGRVL